MSAVLQSRVPADAEGRTLLAWLVARFRYFGATEWSAQIAAGRVQRNGALAGPDDVLRRGDSIAFRPDDGDAPAPLPQAALLLADDDVVAVDKPPHLVVQAGSAFVHNTFLRALAQRLAASSAVPSPGEPWLEPAHRLDRETSGVLLLARHVAAARDLQQQFAAGGVTKQYVAVVHGVVAADTLAIDAPIGPAPASSVAARRAVVPAGSRGARAAVTEVTVERRLRAHSVLRVVPRTGRTHQVRVHLEHAGHPIVGDKLYGRSDAEYAAYVQRLKAGGDPRRAAAAPDGGEGDATRQLLHAASLALLHPRNHEPLQLQAPLPADLEAFVAAQASLLR